jgi:hypothetical protein
MIGFVLGGYFAVEVADRHKTFMVEEMEKCHYERGVYMDLCGDVEYLIENEDYQECINECYKVR